MTPKRAAACLGGGTLLAAWIAAAAAPSFAPEPVSEPVNQQASTPDRQVLELAAETARLVERLAVAVAPRPVTRNLFQFASRAAKASSHDPSSREALALPPPASLATPRIVLLGVAEDRPGADPQRTAILTLAGELLLVKEGQPIGNRYRMIRIGSDAIEVEDTTESRRIQIALP